MRRITPEQVDECLPQTQCGLCGYGGCMPYAEAMIFENAAINLCPPGGVNTLLKLGELLGEDPHPYMKEMEAKSKPKVIATIREDECIGCTKCIQVCPVDAILGSAKEMHTVIAYECTGCELCIPACPVDCIDLIRDEEPTDTQLVRQNLARTRFNAREKRLAHEKAEKKLGQSDHTIKEKQRYIEAAIARVKAKRNL